MSNPTTEISSYPSNFEDTGNSWPSHSSGDNLTTTLANRIRNSILSIQKELGINPSGAYSTVGLKLDNLVETYQPQFIINSSNEGYFGENDFLLFQDSSVDSGGFDRKVAIGWNKDLEYFYFKKDAGGGVFANFLVDSTIYFTTDYQAAFSFDRSLGEFALYYQRVDATLRLPGATSSSFYLNIGNASYIWEQSSLDLRFHVGRYLSFRRGNSAQSLSSAYIDLGGTSFYLYSDAQSSSTTRFVANASDIWISTAANNKNVVLSAHGTGYVNFLNNLGFVIGSGTANGMSFSSGWSNIMAQSGIGFYPNATSPSSLGTASMFLTNTEIYGPSGGMNLGKQNAPWGTGFINSVNIPVSTPNTPTATISGSGSVLIGNYIYKVSCIDLLGFESSPSASSNSVSVTTNNVAISIQFTSTRGARGYRIYRSSNGGLTWGLLVSNLLPTAYPAPVNGTYEVSTITFVDNLASLTSASLPTLGAAYSSVFKNTGGSFVFDTTETDDTFVFTVAGGPSGYCNHSRSLFRIMSGTSYLSMGFNNYGRFEMFSPSNIDFVSGTRGYALMQLRVSSTEVSTYQKFTNSFTTDIASNVTQMQIGYRSIRFAQKSGDDASAGTLVYRRWDTNALEIIGAGASSSRLVRVYDYLGIGAAGSTSFRLNAGGPININSGVDSGPALYCNGSEIIWRNGTYISWGYSTTYNFFDKPITIGSGTNPNNISLWVTGKALASTACVIRQSSAGGGTPADVFSVQGHAGNTLLSISPSSHLSVTSVKANNVSRIIYNSQIENTTDGFATFPILEELNNTAVIKCMGKYIYRTGDKKIRCCFKAKTGDEWSSSSGGYSLWVNGNQVAAENNVNTGGFWDVVNIYWDIEGLADGACVDVGLAAQSGGCNQRVSLSEAVIVVEST